MSSTGKDMNKTIQAAAEEAETSFEKVKVWKVEFFSSIFFKKSEPWGFDLKYIYSKIERGSTAYLCFNIIVYNFNDLAIDESLHKLEVEWFQDILELFTDLHVLRCRY
jgi:hypothetical protein